MPRCWRLRIIASWPVSDPFPVAEHTLHVQSGHVRRNSVTTVHIAQQHSFACRFPVYGVADKVLLPLGGFPLSIDFIAKPHCPHRTRPPNRLLTAPLRPPLCPPWVRSTTIWNRPGGGENMKRREFCKGVALVPASGALLPLGSLAEAAPPAEAAGSAGCNWPSPRPMMSPR